jgi:hypothetical protein
MTPTVGWTEQDYFRATRAARLAWERTSPQLVIDGWLDMLDRQDDVLDETEAFCPPKGDSAAVSVSSSAPPSGTPPPRGARRAWRARPTSKEQIP